MITIAVNSAYDLTRTSGSDPNAALASNLLDLSISPQDGPGVTVGWERILRVATSAVSLGGNDYRLTYTINHTQQDTIAKTVVVDFTSTLSGAGAYSTKPATGHDVTVTHIAAYDVDHTLLYEIDGIEAAVSTNSLWDRFSTWRQDVLQSDALTVINHPDGDGSVTTGAFADSVVGGSGVDNVMTLGGDDTVLGGGGDDWISGGAGNDVIDGGAGDDEIWGGAGSDVIDGGAGDDEIWGGAGNDVIDGGAGNDRLYWGSAPEGTISEDTVHGGDGDDLVSFIDPGWTSRIVAYGDAGNDTLLGAAGSDTLDGGTGSDLLSGFDGNDSLTGGDGADTLRGDDGADRLQGGAGDDRLDGGAGADTLEGGAGDDTYVVDADDTIQLSGTIEDYSATWNGTAFVLTDRREGGDGVDTVSGSVHVAFSDLATAEIDSLLPSLSLTGTDGDDDLEGGDGDDMLAGGAGDDWLRGHARADRLDGGSGNDTLDGGGGADNLVGGDGDDLYLADAADTVVETAAGGTDTVRAAEGLALAANVENLEVLDGAPAGATYSGNALANRVTGSSSFEELRGEAGNDTLVGNGGYDTLAGGTGDDRYEIGADGAVIREVAGEGHDLVITRSDTVLSANVEDGSFVDSFDASFLFGNDLGNRLTGDAQANALFGSAGNDTLVGGYGDDTLVGGAGADRLDGGSGNDEYAVDASDAIVETASGGIDTVMSATDLVLGANLENGILASTATNLTGNGLANWLTGNARANLLSGGDGADVLQGDAGKDRLLGGTGSDTLDGGTGNDTLEGGTGRNSLTGGLGDDVFRIVSPTDRVVELRSGGTDRVETALSHALAANVENLRLTGTGSVSGFGNGLANALTGNGAENRLSGGLGNDTLSGSFGNDTLRGDAGNDRIEGGRGADLLSGGAGHDVFLFRTLVDSTVSTSGRDTIIDFAAGDRIDLSQIDASSKSGGNQAFAFLDGAAAASKAGALYYAGKTGLLWGDVNGDNRADFSIKLAAQLDLDKADFLL